MGKLAELYEQLEDYINDRSKDDKVVPCCDKILKLKLKDPYTLAIKLFYLGILQRWDEHYTLIKWADKEDIFNEEVLKDERIKNYVSASNFSEIYREKIVKAIKEKNYPKADKYCNKWLNISGYPDTETLIFKAQILAKTGMMGEALNYINKTIDPDSASKRSLERNKPGCYAFSRFYVPALKTRAKILTKLKKYLEAIKDYEEILRVRHRDEEAKVFLKRLRAKFSPDK